jgi:branched-chain amino acid transport system substrate-binding protein
MRHTIVLVLLVVLAGGFAEAFTPAAFATAESRPAVIGAVYPTGGPQKAGGLDEFHGVELAAEYVNRQGGVRGRSIQLSLESANSWDAAPGAVERLHQSGMTIVIGSYGSTISRPAATAASRLGMLFWETGAVGDLSMRLASGASGDRVFRFAPTGAALGRAAVAFVRDQLTPHLRRSGPLRYAVAYVDDPYGRAVGLGAVAEVKRSTLPLAAVFPYDPLRTNYDTLVDRIRQARPDVLVVAAYLEDGIALRRTIVRKKIPLAVNIGTSSSYCMPAFGQILGEDAVGVFASDKPDAAAIQPERLLPEAAAALRWARDEFRRRYGGAMSAAGLSGFAGGIALFGHVLPLARDLSPDAVAQAARQVHLPSGSLPDGSGLAFARSRDNGVASNLEATGVIWEWIRPKTREIVWPPIFATHSIVFP